MKNTVFSECVVSHDLDFKLDIRGGKIYTYLLFVVLMCMLLNTSSLFASTYIDSNDEIYYDLSRLEAEGMLPTGLLSTKPVSRKDAMRLLHESESRSEGSSTFIKELIRSLRDLLRPTESSGSDARPIDTLYAKYVYTDSGVHTLTYAKARENEQAFNYNNNGDLYKKGSNFRMGFTSRIEDLGPFSFYMNPEFRNPNSPDSGNDLSLLKAYGVLSLPNVDIEIGKDAQWWGPGYHGSLLLSNNAVPLTIIKFTNPVPFELPWILKSFGPFKFVFFVSKLEKARRVAEPYMWGLRFDFKPHANLEIGLERTALLGGHGRPSDLGIWYSSLYGANNADNCWNNCYREPGDQRAGLDIKYTLPSQTQPVQIYLEADGEDEFNNLPNLWAFVSGVYLPRVLSVERIDLRMEYAITRGRSHTPYTWYTHSIFDSYTYHGMIMGHHIGTDSDDLFIETSYLVPESSARWYVNYDREQHNLYVNASHEITHEISLGLRTYIAKNFAISAAYGHGWLRNIGNVYQKTVNADSFSGQLNYTY